MKKKKQFIVKNKKKRETKMNLKIEKKYEKKNDVGGEDKRWRHTNLSPEIHNTKQVEMKKNDPEKRQNK